MADTNPVTGPISCSAINPLAAAAAADSERNGLGVASGAEQQASKNASQMSLQEILASRKYWLFV